MQLRWPWVPREMYETADKAFSEMCAAFNRQSDVVDKLRDDIREQRVYMRTLVQTIVEMRREGFASQPKAAQPERSARANVEEAIRLAAGGDKGHASVLRAWVASRRAEGIEEDVIAKELLQPAPAESDGVPA